MELTDKNHSFWRIVKTRKVVDTNDLEECGLRQKYAVEVICHKFLLILIKNAIIWTHLKNKRASKLSARSPRCSTGMKSNSIEIYCCVPNILRVSFTQYNNCRYRIYWAWYFSLATKKLSNM